MAKELTEMFTPEEVPLFGSNSALDWANFHAQAFSDESLSFDEVCHLHKMVLTNSAKFVSFLYCTLPSLKCIFTSSHMCPFAL